ncbi:MAG: hypothetical protein SFY66_27370 [Oculatellaceae cyanobacterium bins.114]|nr:hypothetical protein [Oculatellaceae cyanobacterium bins.114]
MKTIDQIYHCQISGQGSNVWHLQCHLCVFQPQAEQQVVIITDMAFEIGWFNPFIVETLVNQVVQEFQLDPDNLVWIEQYSSADRTLNPTDFSRVTFVWQDKKAINPQWQAIAPEASQTFISQNLQRLPA